MADAATVAFHSVSLIAAAMFLFVGWTLSRRETTPEMRPPLLGFVTWWLGLGAVTLLGVALRTLLPLTELSLGAVRVVVYGLFVVLFAALGGLVYYLAFLYSGRRSLLGVTILFYIALFALLVYLYETADIRVVTENGEKTLQAANERAPGHPLSLLFTFSLVVPPLLAALAYFALVFQVDDRTARYRVLLTSGGIVVWFAYSLTTSLFRVASGDTGASIASQIIGQLLGLLAATLVLLAYYPPRSVQARFRVRSIRDETVRREPAPTPARRMPPMLLA